MRQVLAQFGARAYGAGAGQPGAGVGVQFQNMAGLADGVAPLAVAFGALFAVGVCVRVRACVRVARIVPAHVEERQNNF